MHHNSDHWTKFTNSTTHWLGSNQALVLSVLLVILWALMGPWMKWSDSHQLIINTTTTIITYLMVFVLQATQNRDGRAIQTKLDAILAAIDEIPDDIMGIEDMSEEEIERIQAKLQEE